MKTNFKNCVRSLICFALCLMLCISQLCIVSFAADEDVTKIFYRDYEDYTDGKWAFNCDDTNNEYGTMSLTEGGSFGNTIKAVQGKNGTGVDFSQMTSTSNGSTTYKTDVSRYASLGKTISDGVIYVAFDMKLNEQQCTTGTKSTGHFHINLTDTSVPNNTSDYNTQSSILGVYGDDTMLRTHSDRGVSFASGTQIYDLGNEYNRIEATVKLDSAEKTQTYTYYVNGVQIGNPIVATEKAVDDESAIAFNGMTFAYCRKMSYFDNFTILHFANSPAADEKIKVEGEGAYVGENELTVKFTDEKLGAGVLVPNITKDSVAVTDGAEPANNIEVTAVREGNKTGEYILTTASPLTAGTYNITVTDVADTIGRGIDTTNNTVAVTAIDRVTKIFYRDYENYEETHEGDSAAFNILNTGSSYGTFDVEYPSGSFARNTKKTEGKDGVGFDLYTGNIENPTKNFSGDYFFNKEGSSIASGQLYFAFTIKPKYKDDTGNYKNGNTNIKLIDSGGVKATETDASAGIYKDFVPGANLHAFLTIVAGQNGRTNGELLGGNATGSNTWDGTKTNKVLAAGSTYNIEVLFDIDNQNIKYYLDGEVVGDITLTGNNMKAIKGIHLELSNIIEYFDNFTIVHYANSPAEDAKIQAVLPEKLYAGAQSFDVAFTDTKLNDAGRAATALVNSVKTNAKLKKGDVEITGIRVDEKTNGKTGEYTVTLPQGTTLEGGNYTLVLDGVTDTIGRKADNYSFYVYDPYKYDVEEFKIINETFAENGTAIVSATVKQPKNNIDVNTENSKADDLYVICALYNDNILIDVKIKEITFVEDSEAAVTGATDAITLPDMTKGEWKIKGFLWGKDDIKPLQIPCEKSE